MSWESPPLAMSWESRQIVLAPGSHRKMLRPGARVTTDDSDGPTATLAVAMSSSGDPEDPEDRGGRAAQELYHKAAKRTSWFKVLRTVHGPQCAKCAEEKMFGRCALHRATEDKPEEHWWHATDADPGWSELTEEARAREAHALEKPGSAWRTEWAELRGLQLRLQGQGHMARTERLEPGGAESTDMVTPAFEGQISFLERVCEWPREWAEGYTLLTCGAVAALGHAQREGAGKFPQCRRLVGEVLIDRVRRDEASGGGEPPPQVYANLTGQLGLVEADPVWKTLHAEATPGLSFATTTVVVASDNEACFQAAKGLHDYISRAGVREWVAGDSDVVCFQSKPRPAEPPPSGAKHRAMVHVGGTGCVGGAMPTASGSARWLTARPLSPRQVPPTPWRDRHAGLGGRQVPSPWPGHEAHAVHRRGGLRAEAATRPRRRGSRAVDLTSELRRDDALPLDAEGSRRVVLL